MTVLIHDLNDENFTSAFPNIEADTLVISNHHDIKKCSGCFYCWTKTPGKCKIDDNFKCFGDAFSSCTEIILISKSCVGDFSPFIKNILKRSLCFVHPHFEIYNSQSEEKIPFNKPLKLTSYFYGKHISDTEKLSLEKHARAQALNLNASDTSINFFRKLSEIPLNIL